MKFIYVTLFLFVFQIGIIAQDSINESSDKDSKPASKENETKESSLNNSSTGGNKNSIELKLGASRGDNSKYASEFYHPIFGFLYQRALTENWSVGLSIQPTLISSNIKGGTYINLNGRPAGDIILAPLDITGSYNFGQGLGFKPFVRGYAGIALAYASKVDISQYVQGTVYHLGIGAGTRYYFTEGFFGVIEIIANGYYGNRGVDNFNNISGEFGLGFAF